MTREIKIPKENSQGGEDGESGEEERRIRHREEIIGDEVGQIPEMPVEITFDRLVIREKRRRAPRRAVEEEICPLISSDGDIFLRTSSVMRRKDRESRRCEVVPVAPSTLRRS